MQLDDVNGVTEVKQSENGYAIRIKEESIARNVLEAAMAQSEVIKFELREPSMNEIFIKAVGESK